MKRIIVIFLLAALLLSGCAPKETVHTVTLNRNGIDYAFTVDTENRTISDGQYTYTYAVRGDTTTITYPNSAQFYWTQDGYLGAGGWDDHYDPQTYTDGDMLIDVIDETTPEPKNGNFLTGLLLAALGAFYTFAPHAAWYLSRGWWYKNAEPSDAALILARISGVIMIVLGLGFAIF